MYVYQKGTVFDTEVLIMQDYSTLSDVSDMGPCNLVIKLSPLNVSTFPQEK